MYLNIYSQFGGTVWEGLGSVALLEKGCHWGQASGLQKTGTIQMLFPLACGLGCQLPAVTTTMLLLHRHGL